MIIICLWLINETMTDYKTYSAEDFIEDEFFRSWVLNPTDESQDFWERWISENYERQEVLQQARSFLLAVDQTYKSKTPISDDRIAKEVRTLLDSLPENEQVSEYKAWNPGIKWSRIAAAAVLLAGSVWWFTQKPVSVTNEPKQITQVTDSLIRITNSGTEPQAVFLSDGSVAVLEKQSSIRFTKNFDGKTRSVYLDGEAFFDVTKNEQKPFLVYAQETVTRVVGTSFRITAFNDDRDIKVAVKTGKVAVYALKDFESPDKNNVINLIPNEQAVFNRGNERLQKEQVADPRLIASKPDQQEITFDDQPANKVFLTIARNYNIDISFDEKLLAGCRITTQFQEETLKQRLEIICEAIDASYVVYQGKIKVNSPGCSR